MASCKVLCDQLSKTLHIVQSPTSLLQLSIHATDTIKQFGFWYEILKQSQWNEKGSEVQLFSVHAANSQVPWPQTKRLHYCYHYSLIIFPIIIKAFPTWILSSSLFSSALFFTSSCFFSLTVFMIFHVASLMKWFLAVPEGIGKTAPQLERVRVKFVSVLQNDLLWPHCNHSWPLK